MIDKILGPQVAIIDNNHDEIRSIEETLNGLNIGNTFYEVDYTEPNFPKTPLNTVELVFLDLYYNPNFNSDFDPYACSDWLAHIVPPDKKYILIVWSKDIYQTQYLLEIMKEVGAPMPFLVETKRKGEYQKANNEYDIQRMLNELNIELEEKIKISTKEFYGQIIAVEPNSILINCLILENPATFEVRRFDLNPFIGYLEPEKNMYLHIKVTNKPGSKIFEFAKESKDLSELFQKSDDFEDIGDISFFEDEDDEHENNL